MSTSAVRLPRRGTSDGELLPSQGVYLGGSPTPQGGKSYAPIVLVGVYLGGSPTPQGWEIAGDVKSWGVYLGGSPTRRGPLAERSDSERVSTSAVRLPRRGLATACPRMSWVSTSAVRLPRRGISQG